MEWSRYCKVIEKDKVVLLANINNGAWTKLSEELFEFINSAIQRKVGLRDFINEFAGPDKEYVERSCKKLMEAGFLIQNNVEKRNKNLVIWEVTRRCNLKCKHCCVNGGETYKDLSLDDEKKIVKELIRRKVDKVAISGGEPFVRKDILNLLEFIRKNYSGEVTISTNGTLIDLNNVKIITECVDKVDISLDGYNGETVSGIRGEGVFEKVIENIKLLKQNSNIPISLSMVVGENNYLWEEEFLKLCERIMVTPIIRSFAPVGRGLFNKEEFIGKEKNDNYYRKKLKKEISVCNCKAGEDVRYITYDGQVYPCQSFIYPEFNMGNILADYDWNMNEEIKKNIDKYKSFNFTFCEACDMKYFCWPCPGELYRKIKLDGIEEIRNICQKIKSPLKNRIWGT